MVGLSNVISGPPRVRGRKERSGRRLRSRGVLSFRGPRGFVAGRSAAGGGCEVVGCCHFGAPAGSSPEGAQREEAAKSWGVVISGPPRVRGRKERSGRRLRSRGVFSLRALL